MSLALSNDFRIGGNRSYGNPILTLYGQLNEIMPTEYSPL